MLYDSKMTGIVVTILIQHDAIKPFCNIKHEHHSNKPMILMLYDTNSTLIPLKRTMIHMLHDTDIDPNDICTMREWVCSSTS